MKANVQSFISTHSDRPTDHFGHAARCHYHAEGVGGEHSLPVLKDKTHRGFQNGAVGLGVVPVEEAVECIPGEDIGRVEGVGNSLVDQGLIA